MPKTLQQLHDEFLIECQYSGKLRPETIRGYRACFTLFAKLMEHITNPKQLNPTIMTEFFTRLEKRERVVGTKIVKTGVKNSTVATYRNKLDKFFKWLVARNHLKIDPFQGIPYPSVLYSDRKYLKKEDVEKIFTAIAFTVEWRTTIVKRRNLAMYTVLLNCGLRKGELIGLKMLDLDFERKEMRIRAETSKSKIDRYIPMNSKVIIALQEYVEERRRGKYTTPSLWVSDAGDRNFTIDGFKHLNEKVKEFSGVKFHPHRFRHTFAINLLNNGSDIYKLKQLLGHTDIRMTCAYLRCLPTKSMQQDVERLSMNSLL
jgi:integrase/recombinase XerD